MFFFISKQEVALYCKSALFPVLVFTLLSRNVFVYLFIYLFHIAYDFWLSFWLFDQLWFFVRFPRYGNTYRMCKLLDDFNQWCECVCVSQWITGASLNSSPLSHRATLLRRNKVSDAPRRHPNSERGTPSIGSSGNNRKRRGTVFFPFFIPSLSNNLLSEQEDTFTHLLPSSDLFCHLRRFFYFPARRRFSPRARLLGRRVCVSAPCALMHWVPIHEVPSQRNKTACNWPEVFSIERRVCSLYLLSMEMSFPA